MNEKIIHGCVLITITVLILSLYFVINGSLEAEKRERAYQERIKECDRRIEALRREYEKINSSDWDEFILFENLNLNHPV